MRITEEDMEFEWAVWGNTKPWWCPKCKTFLSSDFYEQCDGTDPMVAPSKWKKHKPIKATSPLTKEEFSAHLLQQHGQSSFEVVDDDSEVEEEDPE